MLKGFVGVNLKNIKMLNSSLFLNVILTVEESLLSNIRDNSYFRTVIIIFLHLLSLEIDVSTIKGQKGLVDRLSY